MDREIKFRAWDKYRMIHFSNFSIGLTKGKKTIPYVYFTEDTFEGEVRMGTHEVMQYTGLQDSKGKDIYEGDILMMFTESSQSDMEVKFENGCFVGEGPFTTCSLIEYTKAKDFISWQITGNIYQNKGVID